MAPGSHDAPLPGWRAPPGDRAGAGERSAAFLSLSEAPQRPPTPRAPFMPSPRKRAAVAALRPVSRLRGPAAEHARGVQSPLTKGTPAPDERAHAGDVRPLAESKAANESEAPPQRPRAAVAGSPDPQPPRAAPSPVRRPLTAPRRAPEAAPPAPERPAPSSPPRRVARPAGPRPGAEPRVSPAKAPRPPEERPPAERPPLTRPASPVRPAAPRAGPSRPASPMRPRAASPVRAAASPPPQVPPAELRASPGPRPRAKVTEGVLARRNQTAAFNAPARPTAPARTASPRAPGAPASPRRVARPARPPPRSPPDAACRVDPLAIEHELGENSFVLDEAAEEAEDAETMQDTVRVHVRVRPCEDEEACAWVTASEPATIMLEPSLAAARTQPNVGAAHRFDGVHTGTSNAEVYAALARPLVQSVLQGYDAVVFAYGQTASGKTYTLSGDEAGNEAGITSRAVQDLFQGIRQGSAQREYLLRVSYLEIYNEVVRDLLEPSNVPQVRDDRRRGPNAVLVAPLHEAVVTSPSQVAALLRRGEAHRHVGATDWNERSSRSHTCFKVTVESWERDEGGAAAGTPLGRHYRVSEMNLVDLAGSERHSMQGAQRRAEGANINKSLLSLGKVIYALSERSAAQALRRAPPATSIHVPYRDSKLTRILQNSLSGRARAAVVCTLNPSASAVDESLSTLYFARRIKTVAVRARRNEYDTDMPLGRGTAASETQALLLRYREEMGALRAKVATLQGERGAPAREEPGGTPGSSAAVPGEPPAAPPRVATPTGSPRARTPPVALTPARSASTDDIGALQARLDQLGSLILRGGDAADASDEEPGTPPRSAATRRGFDFGDPPHVVQEKLHAALSKIARLERQLAARLSLPASARGEKDETIEALRQQVRELETVCEAQLLDAPPKVREDVEREWQGRLHAAEQQVQERDAFIAELSRECERLRRTNKRLVRLAHQQTADMVAHLRERTEARPMMSVFMPQLRPATVLGRAPIAAPSTPVSAQRLDAPQTAPVRRVGWRPDDGSPLHRRADTSLDGLDSDSSAGESESGSGSESGDDLLRTRLPTSMHETP